MGGTFNIDTRPLLEMYESISFDPAEPMGTGSGRGGVDESTSMDSVLTIGTDDVSGGADSATGDIGSESGDSER